MTYKERVINTLFGGYVAETVVIAAGIYALAAGKPADAAAAFAVLPLTGATLYKLIRLDEELKSMRRTDV